MQIQKLEEELGLIIFDRTKQPIIPTADGEKLIQQARRAIIEFNRIEEVISDNELSGTFHVGVIPTLSPYVIPLFLKDFIENFPKVDLKIEEMKTEDIITGLERDEIDAGILVTPLHNNQFVEKPLFYENFKLYVCKDHVLSKKEKIKEKDLKEDGLWILNEGHCFRDQVLNICKLKAMPTKSFTLESGSLETLMRLVDTAGGYTLIPEMATLNIKNDAKKYIRSFEGAQPVREVSIVYSRLFLKEKHINLLEEIILENVPSCVETRKNKLLKVINI
ncbi:LysR substrate-binding domain-containing protein [Bacteriovoracaceae bacterium]|nr:LysR substrate-binding domain-containing protein [Bacteriovoracaceae bacterium]